MAKSRNVERSVVEKEFFETIRPSSLVKRFATIDEVAALVAFVASPLSSATNGAALRVDGGYLAAPANGYDFILDTVSAPHDLNAYLNLLRRDGVMVGGEACTKAYGTSLRD